MSETHSHRQGRSAGRRRTGMLANGAIGSGGLIQHRFEGTEPAWGRAATKSNAGGNRLAAARFGLAVATGLLAVQSARAANDAWSTAPASANFSGINWTTGTTTPGAASGTAATGDALYFGTSSITTLNNDDTNFSFSGLNFISGGNAFVLGGNGITLTGNVVNSSTLLQTINFNTSLGATISFAGGSYSLGGNISSTAAGNGLSFNVGGNGTTVTLTGANTFNGAIAIGSGSVVTVSSINSVNGAASSNLGAPTTVANGTISLGGGSAPGTLKYVGTGETTNRNLTLTSSSSASTGILDQSGTGNLNFSGIIGNTTTSNPTVNHSITLQGSTAGTGQVSGTIINNNAVGSTGTMAVTKAGSGLWTLSGANNYSGGTTLNAGTLVLNNGSSAVTTTSAIGTGTFNIAGGSIDSTVAGITLGTNNAQLWTNNFTFVGTQNLNLGTGPVTLGAANRTVTVSANTLTVGGVVGDSGFGFNKSGSGTLALTGSSTYTGPATVNAGTLAVSVLANGGVNSGLGASTNAASNLILNGGTLQYAGTSAASTDHLFTLGANGGTLDASGVGSATFSNTGNVAFSGASAGLTLTGSNTGANTLALALVDGAGGSTTLTKSGGGRWVLSNVANTYSGTTSINAGTLALASGAGISSSAVTVGATGTLATAFTAGGQSATLGSSLSQANGGAVDLRDGVAGTLNVGGLTLNGGTLGYDIGATGDSIADSGAYAGGGSNAITLVNLGSINTANTYSLISGAAGISTSNFALTNPSILAGYNASLQVNGGDTALQLIFTATGGATTAYWNVNGSAGFAPASFSANADGSGTVGSIDSGTAITFSSTAANASGTAKVATLTANQNIKNLSVSDPSAVTITGGFSLDVVDPTGVNISGTAGSTTISTSGLILGSSQTWTNNSLNAATVSSVVSGGGSALTIAGTGTFVLTGVDTYTGATTINSGATLQLGDGTTGHDGTIAGTSGVTDNGTLTYNRFGATTAAYVIGGTGGVVVAGPGTQTLTAAETYAGATTINAGGTLQLGDGTTGHDGTIAGTSGVTDNGTLTYNRFGTSTAAYVISGTGGVVVAGPGTQTLTAAETYTGSTTINAGATLQLGDGTTGHDGSIAGTTGVTDNGTLTYNRFGTSTAAYVVSGTGGVVAAGPGTQTLTAAETYTGSTTINAGGTLQLGDGTTGHDGTIAGTSGVTDNGTLTYNRFGTSTAAYVISGTGAVVIAGAGTQTLTAAETYTGATTVNAGATLQLGDGTTGHDGSIASSGVTDNGTLVFNRFTTGTTLTSGTAISGSGNLVMTGAGEQTLSNSNSYAGTTTIENGVLRIQNAASLGSGTSAILLGDAASIAGNLSPDLRVNGAVTLARNVVVGASNAATTGTYTIDTDNFNSALGVTGNITLNQSVTVFSTSNGGFTLGSPGGTISSGSTGTQTLTLNPANNTNGMPIPSNIGSGTGTIAVVKLGAGVITFSGTNTYAGGTTVSAGFLRVNNASGSGTGTGDVVINGTTGTSFGTLGGTGFAGNISTGAGAAPGTGVVTVNGFGNITAGASNVSTGTLTTGTESWNSSSGQYLAKVFDASNTSAGSTTAGNDRLIMSALTITSGFSVNLNMSSGTLTTVQSAPGTVLLLANDKESAGTNPFNTGGAAPAGLVLKINGDANTGSTDQGLTLATQADALGNGGFDLILMNVVAAPEPTSLLLLGVAGIPLGLGRRRRRA